MPPPSPTQNERKEQLHARNKPIPAVLKPEAQRRHSSMQTASTEPERKQTTTATYTQQYLQRRRSQQGLTYTARDKQSPKTNGTRRITRRRSSEDLGASSERPKGLLLDGKLENGHKENGYPSVADTAVEKMPLKASENVVAAVSGTGIPLNDGTCGTIEHDAVSKVTMAKKRKRSTVVMTLVGVVTVTVVGGLAICRLYPSSPAAEAIRFGADKVNEGVYMLLIEMRKEVGAYVEVVWTKWKVLQSREMQNTARAAEALVKEKFSVPPWFTKIAAVSILTSDIRSQLQSSVSALVDALKLSVEWMQAHVVEWIELELNENELFEQARSFMLTALSSLAEWTKQTLDQIFEWTGLKSNSSDVNLPSDHFLAPLVTHQAAIQNIGRVLTTQESQALQDVKRLEKRRVTIASDTYSIIADTRNIALESIVDVKMAALEFIEMRLKRLEEQYARVFDQALKNYEHTSRQLENEGGVEMLSEISAENQSPVDAAATFKQNLTPHEKIVDEQPMEPTGSENQDLYKGESPDESATDKQTVQRIKEERLPEEVAEFPAPAEQGSAEDIPGGSKEETQIVAELAREDIVELTETRTMEHSFSEEATNSEHAAEDQTETVAGLTELTIEVSVPVEKNPSSLEDVFDGGHVIENQAPITAKLTEEDLLTVELDSTDKEEVVGTVKKASVTEVLIDSGNGVLEMEHTDLKVTEFLEAQNQSEVEKVKHQQEDRVEAHVRVPVDGAEVDLAVKLDNRAGKKIEVVEQFLPDVRTRIAVQAKSEEEDKLNAENMAKVEKDVAEEVVFAEVQREEKAELVRLHSDNPALEKDVQGNDAGSGNEGQQENTGALQLEEETNVVTIREADALETERVEAAKEIQELEQLEQVLLQEEGERVRVEEELRAIAEEEEIWLQSEQAPAEDKVYQDDAVPDQHITSTIAVMETSEVVVDSKSDDWQSNPGIPASEFPTSVGLLSVVFLVLAVLTAYLLTRHCQRGLFARPPRRRRRWRRHADMSESDTEEVVLLPDDSSNEEDGTDLASPKEPHLEVVEHTSSVEVNATAIISSEGEEVVEEEETNEDHEAGEEKEKDVEESDLVTTRSRSVVVERVQTATYTVDHPATPDSDAAGEKSDTAITTPPASKQETPDTSQRMTLRRRREIRT